MKIIDKYVPFVIVFVVFVTVLCFSVSAKKYEGIQENTVYNPLVDYKKDWLNKIKNEYLFNKTYYIECLLMNEMEDEKHKHSSIQINQPDIDEFIKHTIQYVEDELKENNINKKKHINLLLKWMKSQWMTPIRFSIGKSPQVINNYFTHSFYVEPSGWFVEHTTTWDECLERVEKLSKKWKTYLNGKKSPIIFSENVCELNFDLFHIWNHFHLSTSKSESNREERKKKSHIHGPSFNHHHKRKSLEGHRNVDHVDEKHHDSNHLMLKYSSPHIKYIFNHLLMGDDHYFPLMNNVSNEFYYIQSSWIKPLNETFNMMFDGERRTQWNDYYVFSFLWSHFYPNEYWKEWENDRSYPSFNQVNYHSEGIYELASISPINNGGGVIGKTSIHSTFLSRPKFISMECERFFEILFEEHWNDLYLESEFQNEDEYEKVISLIDDVFEDVRNTTRRFFKTSEEKKKLDNIDIHYSEYHQPMDELRSNNIDHFNYWEILHYVRTKKDNNHKEYYYIDNERGREIEENSWTLSLYYHPLWNSIHCNPYFMSITRDIYNNNDHRMENLYGIIYYTMAHEMYHSIDRKGITFDKYGFYVGNQLWNNYDREKSVKIINKFHFDSLNDGFKTYDENNADINGALISLIKYLDNCDLVNERHHHQCNVDDFIEISNTMWDKNDIYSDGIHSSGSVRSEIPFQYIKDTKKVEIYQ